MANLVSTIQFKRGTYANLPQLANGEPALTTDTQQIWLGNDGTNILLNPINRADIEVVNTFAWFSVYYQANTALLNSTPTYSNANPTIKPTTGPDGEMYTYRGSNIEVDSDGLITFPSGDGTYEIVIRGRFQPTTFTYMPAINCQAQSGVYFNIYFPVSSTEPFEVNQTFSVQVAQANNSIKLNFNFQNAGDSLVTYVPTTLLDGATANTDHVFNQLTVAIRKISNQYM